MVLGVGRTQGLRIYVPTISFDHDTRDIMISLAHPTPTHKGQANARSTFFFSFSFFVAASRDMFHVNASRNWKQSKRKKKPQQESLYDWGWSKDNWFRKGCQIRILVGKMGIRHSKESERYGLRRSNQSKQKIEILGIEGCALLKLWGDYWTRRKSSFEACSSPEIISSRTRAPENCNPSHLLFSPHHQTFHFHSPSQE